MKKILTILFTVHCSLVTIHMSEAQIIHVPADQPTIQAGIDAASDGDTVLVAGGTYFENINFMGKAITVASNFILDSDTNHINNTIIDGSMPDDPDYGSVVTFLTGEDTTSVLCGFTITGGTGMIDPVYGARTGGGILCYYATAKIIHNKITGNVVNSGTNAWGGGIAIIRETGDNWTVIENNTIRNNQSIAMNTNASGGGAEVWGNARICYNIIENNSCDCALGAGTGGGIFLRSYNNPPDTLYLSNNIIQNNTIEGHDYAEGGGVCTYSSYAIFSSNTIKSNTVSSMNLAGGGGVGCDYTEAYFTENEISYNFASGSEVQGGGIYLLLSAEADFTGNEISHNAASGPLVRGGGVCIMLPVNVEFRNNEVSNDSCITNTDWFGAGVYCYKPTGTTKFISNEFANNWGRVQPIGGGGGLWVNDAFELLVSIDGNLFKNNTAYNGGGLFVRGCYNASITNNIFSGNHANFAGGLAIYHPTVKSGETVQETRASQPRIYNNTFYSNSAVAQGGAFRYQGDLNIPKIMNSIFWLNSIPSVANIGIGTLDISWSDINENEIAGSWSGQFNINADPLFIPSDPFYHLSPGSPCVNSGTQNLQTPTHDYDGEPRPDPVNGLMDMGADEFWDVPEAPVALYPDTIGDDYFVARWHRSIPLALGYKLDVAYDMNFEEFVPGYENLDVGEDTSKMVINLAGLDCYYRVRAYNAVWISPNSETIFVIWNGVETPFVPNSRFQVQCFPNPTFGIVDFQFSTFNFRWVSLKIFDLHGRQVAVVLDEKLPAGEHSVQFDLSNLPAGIYLFSATTNDQTVTQKLIIKH